MRVRDSYAQARWIREKRATVIQDGKKTEVSKVASATSADYGADKE